MEITDPYFTDEIIIKKFDDNISSSEYTIVRNKLINISVNQSVHSMQYSYEKFINYLLDNDYKILSQFLFGNHFHEKENKLIANKYFGELTWPVTVIKQQGEAWGTMITAIKSDHINTIYHKNLPIGTYYFDEHSEYCFLGGLLPELSINSRELSTNTIFQLIESELNKINMNFNNVVRTWFYLDDLLNWYKEFNIVRTSYFNQKGIFNKLIPASTGIGAKNIAGGYLSTAAYVIKPKSEKVKIYAVPSPLQCPAVDYKSSFSRAIEIVHPDYNNLIVSGTASINSDGHSANIGNVYKQIELTMNVVNGILESREMNWGNVIKGIVYFKNINDIDLYYEYCYKNNIPDMPLTIIQADICREELLFEIEIDAIRINKSN